MTWDITYGGNTVSLPNESIPNKVRRRYSAVIKDLSIPGEATLMLWGTKGEVMEWIGVLTDGAKTNDQLYTDYVTGATKLEGFLRREVSIGGTTPTRYSGSWVLTDADIEERGGVVKLLWYKLTFTKGGMYIPVG